MPTIITDAMKAQISLEIAGVAELLNDLNIVNTAVSAVNDKSAKMAQALDMDRLKIEGKFSPESQREFELKSLIQLQDRLNLSTEIYRKMKQEIKDRYLTATAVSSTEVQLPGQDAVVEYRRQLAEEERLNQERIDKRERVQKELDRIQNEELTSFQRWFAEKQRIVKLRTDNIITVDEAKILRDRANTIYNDEIAANARQRDIQTQHYLKQKELRDKRIADAKRVEEAERNTIKTGYGVNTILPLVDFTKTLEANTATTRTNNAERQRALAMLNGTRNAMQLTQLDILRFDAALAAGTITTTEHAEAIDNLNRRMRSMAGGAGNMGYVVGNVMTGLEDFTTVLSITGFGMDGFAAATRSASNNVGQAVRSMGTAASAIYAPLVSIGMVLVGFAIPAVYRWVTGSEEAAKATKKWADELARLQRMMTIGPSQALLDFERMMNAKDIKKLFDVKQLEDNLDTATDAVKKLGLELDELEKKGRATGVGALDQVLPQESMDKFDKLVNYIGKSFGGNYETILRTRMKEIRETFITEVSTLGGEEAAKRLKRNMEDFDKLLSAIMREVRPNEGAGKIIHTMRMDLMDDIDARIEAAKEELDKIDKSNTLAESEKRDEIKTMEEKKRLLQEQLDLAIKLKEAEEEKNRERDNIIDKLAAEKSLKELELQSKKNRMIGEEFEAERKILELAERRQELLVKGAFLAPQAQLEDMFNAELEAMAAQIEKDLKMMDDITVKADAQSQASAYTQANKMILEVKNDGEEVREKEMIELLKAIKDHLAGRNVLNLELM